MVFWSDKAAVALAGLMHAAAVGGYDMAKVYLWANRAGEAQLAELARRPGASRELFAGLGEIYTDTKAASSIRMTLLRSLGWLAVPELRDMVCGPQVRPVDAGEFAASRSTLYMILRDGSSSVAAPLFRLICDLMHHEGNLAATRTRYRRHVPGVFFAVDEVANIGLPKLAQKLADSAGFGSFMAIVIHSVAQLREAYGADAAAAILACCGTKVIMPGLTDAGTLDDLSVLCGTIPSEQGPARVVMPEVIERLPGSRALVLHANLSPLVVKFRTPWRRWSYRLGLLPHPRPSCRPRCPSWSRSSTSRKSKGPPMPPDPEITADGTPGETLARFAVVLAAHRGQLAEHAAQLKHLADTVAALSDGGPKGPPMIAWPDLGADEAAAVRADLARWVEQALFPLYPSARESVRDCWPSTPTRLPNCPPAGWSSAGSSPPPPRPGPASKPRAARLSPTPWSTWTAGCRARCAASKPSPRGAPESTVTSPHLDDLPGHTGRTVKRPRSSRIGGV